MDRKPFVSRRAILAGAAAAVVGPRRSRRRDLQQGRSILYTVMFSLKEQVRGALYKSRPTSSSAI